jgi:hypothetical protein
VGDGGLNVRSRRAAARWWLALVVATSGLWVALTSGIAVADCSGRSLTANPHSAPQGSTVTIRGEGWFGKCVDSGSACTKTGVFDPEQDIKLWIVLRNSGGLGRVLAIVDANENFGFVVRKSLPRDLLPGSYRLMATPIDGSVGAATALRVTAG